MADARWAAMHQGPHGILSRAERDAWVEAANWLRAMMEVARPEGIEHGMRALAATAPGASFAFRTTGHSFELAQ